MANFAPYQDTDPAQERALSPPRRDLSRSPISRSSPSQRNIADSISGSLPNPNHFSNDDLEAGPGASALGGRSHVNLFETSLPMRLDYEAVMAYLLLPPAGGVFLLLVEHKSDYVRFHAWQSSLVFSMMFVIHLIFSFNSVISWIIFAIDVIMIAFLSLRAYQDADTLDRYELPFFGQLASKWVDVE